MKVFVLTLFPELFPGSLGVSVLGRALRKNLWSLKIIDISQFSPKPLHGVDGRPAGGGAGMIIRADVLEKAFLSIPVEDRFYRRLCLSPRGIVLTQARSQSLSTEDGLILICGRYEGIDERFLTYYNFQEYSLGDFILAGGEIAATAVVESCIRLIPGVVGNTQSLKEETFSQGTLEYPQYTTPTRWHDLPIPDVLRSGNHQHIIAWRKKKSRDITENQRPDLCG